MTPLVTRRDLLRWGLAGGAAAFVPRGILRGPTAALAQAVGAYNLTANEFAILTAAAARIIPADDKPGAVQAGAPDYINRMLSFVPSGDVNVDGAVGAADLAAAVTQLATGSTGPFPGADINADGKVDAADLALLSANIFDEAAQLQTAAVYAGGPFSDRNPFPDPATGTPSTRFPSNHFAQTLPLTRLQLMSWRVHLLGSKAVAGADFNEAVLGPTIGLRERYRNGLGDIEARSRSAFGSGFAALTTAQQDEILAATDAQFLDLVTGHIFEGMFCPPEYGGNKDLIGWNLIGYGGDSQPLGYSIFDETTMSYNERADKPTSTANPDEDFSGVDADTQTFLRLLVRVVGGPHFPSVMADLPSRVPGVLGNTSLAQFDVVIIGSGAGGSMAARTLAKVGGKKVLILEHGPNYFAGLDDPAPGMPIPAFSNDEIKLSVRGLIDQDPFLEPRSFREDETGSALAHPDVNTLPKTVGGAAVHADMKYPRFNVVDFHIASELAAKGIAYAGTNFADWPVSYAELEPFYGEAERLTGVQGQRGANPFESYRSGEFLMPPGVPMYVGQVLSDGATAKGYHPFPYPSAVNSRPYGGRPPCIDCGFCSGFGCPNNSKCSPAVTTLREALLTGNVQLRYNCHVTRLRHQDGHHVTGLEYIDGDGNKQTATAGQFILAASAIESARLCLLSDLGAAGLGNSSGLLGRNLMFHTQNLCVGIYKQRFHGERGRSVTHGMADFRGVLPGGEAIDPNLKLGGIIEFGTDSEAITAAKNNLQALQFAQSQGLKISLKQLLVNSPFLARIAALIQQAEDAPYLRNRIDLDPAIKDVFGTPVPRITYAVGAFENDARRFYGTRMLDIQKAAGAQYGFIAPIDSPSSSRHIMGTLRMGTNPTSSVCDAHGKLHDVDNLYNMDGGVFVTSSGYNPTLTLITLALRAAANIVSPGAPERVIGRDSQL